MLVIFALSMLHVAENDYCINPAHCGGAVNTGSSSNSSNKLQQVQKLICMHEIAKWAELSRETRPRHIEAWQSLNSHTLQWNLSETIPNTHTHTHTCITAVAQPRCGAYEPIVWQCGWSAHLIFGQTTAFQLNLKCFAGILPIIQSQRYQRLCTVRNTLFASARLSVSLWVLGYH